MSDKAQIATRYERLSVHYTITGKLEAVKEAVEAIKTGFPPNGYMTVFDPPVEIQAGLWKATGNRSRSCD